MFFLLPLISYSHFTFDTIYMADLSTYSHLFSFKTINGYNYSYQITYLTYLFSYTIKSRDRRLYHINCVKCEMMLYYKYSKRLTFIYFFLFFIAEHVSWSLQLIQLKASLLQRLSLISNSLGVQ